MKITKTKSGVEVHMGGKFPTEPELVRLNELFSGKIYIDTERGYPRMLIDNPVYLHGRLTAQVCTMECPLNETFTL